MSVLLSLSFLFLELGFIFASSLARWGPEELESWKNQKLKALLNSYT